MADEPLTPAQIEAAYVRYVQLISHVAENAAHIAAARRSLYLAYVAEGFSEEQALVLCQQITIS